MPFSIPTRSWSSHAELQLYNKSHTLRREKLQFLSSSAAGESVESRRQSPCQVFIRLHFEFRRMQNIDVCAFGLAIKNPLRHQKTGTRSILDAPARMTRRNPNSRCRRRAYQRTPLLAETDVLRDIAGLLGFDRCCR